MNSPNRPAATAAAYLCDIEGKKKRAHIKASKGLRGRVEMGCWTPTGSERHVTFQARKQLRVN